MHDVEDYKMIRIISITALLLFLPASTWSFGGEGANCNPSVEAYPVCQVEASAFESEINSTIEIPGGHYPQPFQANKANTRYVLQGDMDADGTGIVISANYLIIDLNGYTITYNNVLPGEGVTSGSYNKKYVHIKNGSIIQGAAMSEGDLYGRGNGPVSTWNSALGGRRSIGYLHVSNLYLRYGGRDVSGIYTDGSGKPLFEQNTVEDTYEFGTLKHRHQGNSAINGGNSGFQTVRNNTIINARHRGVGLGSASGSIVSGNKISVRSIATNAAAVFTYGGDNHKIYNNIIEGIGEHPIGVMMGGGKGSVGCEVYNNEITLQVTAIGEEYAGGFAKNPDQVFMGNSASGIRVTWGGDKLDVHDNVITIKTSKDYTGTFSPTGETAKLDGGGKGLNISGYAGQSSDFYNNVITVTGDSKHTYGVTCATNQASGLFVYGNTITSEQHNIVIGDDYGACDGYAFFAGNRLIKYGDHPNYATYANTYNWDDKYKSYARIVDNSYVNGAAEDSIKALPERSGHTDWYFGRMESGTPVFSYRLWDVGNTSAELVRVDYDPAITLDLPYPSIQMSNPAF